MNLRQLLYLMKIASFASLVLYSPIIEGLRQIVLSKYRVTKPKNQSSDFLLKCAVSASNETYGHKINISTGECSAGNSSNQDPGFLYLDKTDTIERFTYSV